MHRKWRHRFAAVALTMVSFLYACEGESVSSLPNQEIQNLRAFARLYGYVKYFHPSDEASLADWDIFAIHGARSVKAAADSEELKHILEDLFLPVAPSVEIYYAGQGPPQAMKSLPGDHAGLEVVAWQHRGLGVGALTSIYESVRARRAYSSFFGESGRGTNREASQPSGEVSGLPAGNLFEEYPRPGEVTDKALDGGLRCRIPLTLLRDETGTLGYHDDDARSKMSSSIEDLPVDQLTADNEYVRLADVIIAWNVFQHFYPYFDAVEVDWDVELTNALRGAMADRTERDFFYTLSRLIAGLRDGHARVFHKTDEELAWLPFGVDWVEDQVVITSSSDSARFRPGDVVLEIDRFGAGQALSDAEVYLSGSPQRKRHVALRRFGYGDPGAVAELVIQGNTETHRIEVRRDYYDIGDRPTGPILAELEDDIYYVDLTRATMRRIRASMDQLAEARGVIFDLRGEPKGNHEIIGHLLRDDTTPGHWRMIPRIIYPDRDSLTGFEDVGWTLEPKRPRIEGEAVFLTDASTISYAEFIMSYVEYFRLGEIVGQPTAGANGSVNAFELPGGFGITWTGMRVVKLDGSRHHAIGIRPTVPVERSIEAVTEGRDESVEEALALVKRRQPWEAIE